MYSPQHPIMKLNILSSVLLVSLQSVSGFVQSPNAFQSLSTVSRSNERTVMSEPLHAKKNDMAEFMFSAVAMAAILFTSPAMSLADDSGASNAANSKITTGGASTLQSGRTIAITRGINLDRTNFEGQNLKGVAFQQSIVRDSNFKGCNLVGASFFDATIDGSDFEGANLSLVNLEMAQLARVNLKDAVVTEMYVSGATIFDGIKSIENSDWSETYLPKYQKKVLCDHPTAKGTNPTTGVDTRESLMCKD